MFFHDLSNDRQKKKGCNPPSRQVCRSHYNRLAVGESPVTHTSLTTNGDIRKTKINRNEKEFVDKFSGYLNRTKGGRKRLQISAVEGHYY